MKEKPLVTENCNHKGSAENGSSGSEIELKGFSGIYTRLLRRYKTLGHILHLLPFYAVVCLVIGLALVPGIALFAFFGPSTAFDSPLRYPIIGAMFALAYLLYGLSLVFIIPLVNLLFVGRLKAWRGKYHSSYSVKWYIHNGLTYIVRYTFLEFITPTPINVFFYKLMGMNVGRNVQLNTTHISDPSLIEIEDNVTVGGSAVLIGHYGMNGFLILAPVKIGKGATIGMRAIVMGAVEIGAGATVLPGSVVLPKSKIPAGEYWGGVPAKKLDMDNEKKKKRDSSVDKFHELEDSPAMH